MAEARRPYYSNEFIAGEQQTHYRQSNRGDNNDNVVIKIRDRFPGHATRQHNNGRQSYVHCAPAYQRTCAQRTWQAAARRVSHRRQGRIILITEPRAVLSESVVDVVVGSW